MIKNIKSFPPLGELILNFFYKIMEKNDFFSDNLMNSLKYGQLVRDS